jgi:hypothetical protein
MNEKPLRKRGGVAGPSTSDNFHTFKSQPHKSCSHLMGGSSGARTSVSLTERTPTRLLSWVT